MMRVLLGFCLCSLTAAVVFTDWYDSHSTAAEPTSQRLETAEPTYEELILELPEDGGTWWVTVCLPDDHHADARSRWLLAALAAEPRLRSLQAQCKTHQFTSTDPMFQSKWSSYVGDLPALVVQMPDGKTCFKASGDNLPDRPERLADEISLAIENCRPCPLPSPSPAPQPAPTPRPVPLRPAPIPDIRPQPAPLENQRDMPLSALLAGLAGAAAGGMSEWRKSNKA